uniref:Uncharacterized protein n=1 Tax=Manihot esculenta TaxID=3983 RepID=A0A2C9V1X2_MANES
MISGSLRVLPGSMDCTRLTRVLGCFGKPINARKRPIPAEELIRTGFGTSFASCALNPIADIAKKIRPSMKTAAHALW